MTYLETMFEVIVNTLTKIYLMLIAPFLFGVVYFYIVGPRQIAQICALGLLWALFGALLNNVFMSKRENG